MPVAAQLRVLWEIYNASPISRSEHCAEHSLGGQRSKSFVGQLSVCVRLVVREVVNRNVNEHQFTSVRVDVDWDHWELFNLRTSSSSLRRR